MYRNLILNFCHLLLQNFTDYIAAGLLILLNYSSIIKCKYQIIFVSTIKAYMIVKVLLYLFKLLA